MYEKQDRNASPSSNEADASLGMPDSPDENNVMDTSKLKGGEGEGKNAKEEEEEAKLTYDAEPEEYEDEDEDEDEKRKEEESKGANKGKKQEEKEEDEEEKEEDEEEDPLVGRHVAKEKSSMTANVSNTEAGDNSRDEDYFEDPSTNQYDNTYYYYDEYENENENENRSRYEAVGKFFSFRIDRFRFLT